MRLRDTLEEPPETRRRRRRIHPMMMKEFIHFAERSGYGPGDPLRFLIMASYVKDDIPWLYELAVDAYHETVNKSPRAKVAQQRVVSAFKALVSGPWMEMFESKDLDMIFHELHRYVDEIDLQAERRAAEQAERRAAEQAALGDILGAALKHREHKVFTKPIAKSGKPDKK